MLTIVLANDDYELVLLTAWGERDIKKLVFGLQFGRCYKFINLTVKPAGEKYDCGTVDYCLRFGLGSFKIANGNINTLMFGGPAAEMLAITDVSTAAAATAADAAGGADAPVEVVDNDTVATVAQGGLSLLFVCLFKNICLLYLYFRRNNGPRINLHNITKMNAILYYTITYHLYYTTTTTTTNKKGL